MCFSLASSISFDLLPEWMNEVSNNINTENMVKYLVGNCADLVAEDELQNSREDAIKFTKDNHFDYYIETSSKTGENVSELFEILTKHLYLAKELEEENVFGSFATKSEKSYSQNFKYHSQLSVKLASHQSTTKFLFHNLHKFGNIIYSNILTHLCCTTSPSAESNLSIIDSDHIKIT